MDQEKKDIDEHLASLGDVRCENLTGADGIICHDPPFEELPEILLTLPPPEQRPPTALGWMRIDGIWLALEDVEPPKDGNYGNCIHWRNIPKKTAKNEI